MIVHRCDSPGNVHVDYSAQHVRMSMPGTGQAQYTVAGLAPSTVYTVTSSSRKGAQLLPTSTVEVRRVSTFLHTTCHTVLYCTDCVLH